MISVELTSSHERHPIAVHQDVARTPVTTDDDQSESDDVSMSAESMIIAFTYVILCHLKYSNLNF